MTTSDTQLHSPSGTMSTLRSRIVGSFVLAAVAAALGACHRQAPATTPAPSTTVQPPRPAPITNGIGVLTAMRAKYPNWYRTATFVQKTTVNSPRGGTLVQTWYEAMSLPGRLRIDFDIKSRSGTLFARDSIYSFSSGKLVRADTGLNDLLVLGFDVYTQSIERSAAELRRLGFDLNRFHTATWQGRPVYVVGAVAGDTVSRQFWIDKTDLVFLRMIDQSRQGFTDVRFENYQPVAGGVMAMQVEQIVNGQRRLLEQYSDVKVNVPLSAALFDPAKWTTVPHWTAPPRR
jgi:hypothetical protein